MLKKNKMFLVLINILVLLLCYETIYRFGEKGVMDEVVSICSSTKYIIYEDKIYVCFTKEYIMSMGEE